MDILSDLTEPQRAAATHVDGPLLVLAGAGSGKTRVVTRRIAYMLSQGVPAWNILALTFTNKAAGEMRERVVAMAGEFDISGLTLTTFHSFGSRFLRRELPDANHPHPGEDPAAGAIEGRTSDYTIYDRGDQVAVVRTLLKDVASDERIRPEGVLHLISETRTKGKNFAGMERGGPLERATALIGPRYLRALSDANAYDFDDLLLRPLAILRADAARAQRYQERYRYVMVDEYQDTNRTQYDLLLLLAKAHRNLAATGDPDQNIYAFRGADLRNILEFEEDFPEAKVVALDQNYRSTKTILAAANELISHNSRRKEKGLWTENETGNKLQLAVGSDAEHEGSLVAAEISKAKDALGVAWNDVAIFYRTNAQSRALEGAMRMAGIPYRLLGGVAFFQRKEVKDCNGYLRCAANPRDMANFRRIINTPPRGIGAKSQALLEAFATKLDIPISDALRRAGEAGLSKRAAASAAVVADVLFAVAAAGTESAASAVKVAVEQSGMLAHLRRDTDPKNEERIENLNELGAAAAEFDERYPGEGFKMFLEEVALIADVDGLDGDDDRATLMTMHASKGLEFPVVAIVGLEEGLLPHRMSSDSESGTEEERRLCYVGMTRAKRQLILARARMRRQFGAAPVASRPSRFLAEIPPETVETVKGSAPDSSFGGGGGGGGFDGWDRNYQDDEFDQTDRLNDSQGGSGWTYVPDGDAGEATDAFRPGERVRHARFGPGTIIRLVGPANRRRATIRFDGAGTRELALDVARLERDDY